MSVRDPYFAKVLRRIDRRGPDECWPWLSSRNQSGYGTFSIRLGPRVTGIPAHRAAFEIFYGPIPEGAQIDHLCKNRACCNPRHLEAVSREENYRRRDIARGAATFHGRKTHCPQGHPYAGDNLYTNSGRRFCKICQRAARLAWAERQKASA